jgi:magnesium transporter
MIEFLRPDIQGLKILEKPEKNCWINVVNPSEEEIHRINAIIQIPEDLLLSLKDVDEIPTIDMYDDFTFIIIRAPLTSKQSEYEYTTIPIGIFVTKNMIVTLSFFENDSFIKLKSQRFKFSKPTFIYRLLLISSRLYLSYLKEIHRKMYLIEAQLERSQKNKVIMDFLELEKSLVFFATSLKSNKILLMRMAKESQTKQGIAKYGIKIVTSSDSRLMDQVLDETNQAIEMANIYSNILTGTLDAFASVISNNLNFVMKILASITIVLSLPTLVASVYGMNISLPLQNDPHAFIIVMAIAFAVSTVSVFVLWKKNFF